jgi:hypothetical protein
MVEAGVTHHVQLGDLGLMLVGIMTRSDITSAIPRVSIGTEQRKHTDFSERDTFGQNSWHHGRGNDDFSDPTTFFEAVGLMTWLPGQITLAPKTTISVNDTTTTDFDGYMSDQEVFLGNLLALNYGNAPSNNALYLFNNTTSQWQKKVLTGTPLNTTNGEPLSMVRYQDRAATTSAGHLYIAQGEANNIIRTADVVAGVNNGFPARRLAIFDSYLWRADNINELYYSADPSTDGSATWTGPLFVGGSEYPIRGMVAGWDGALWVGKDDGVYAVRFEANAATPAYVVYKIIDLSHDINSNNGRGMMQFGGNLYITTGNDLIRFDGTTIQYVGPSRGGTGQDSTYQVGQFGRVTGLAHDGNFIYASVEGSPVQSSRIMVYTGTGWHTLVENEATTGDPMLPNTTANDNAVGTVAWSNTDNAKLLDAVYATALVGTSQYLKLTNFLFDVDTSLTISGVDVEVYRRQQVDASFPIPAFKAVGAVGAGDTSVIITRPAVVLNDFMIAAVASDGVINSNPAGWTLLGAWGTATRVFYKVAGGSEPATYTWGASSGTRIRGQIAVWENIDPVSPIDKVGSTATGLSPLSTPAVTPTNPYSMVLTIGGLINATNSGGHSVGSGYTKAIDFAFTTPDPEATEARSAVVAYKLSPLAESTGTVTVAITPAQSLYGFQVVLKPATIPATTSVVDNSVSLVIAGVAVGDDKAAGGTWPTARTQKVYGGSSDKWGNALTPAIVNASGFGVAISATVGTDSQAEIDTVQITVYAQTSDYQSVHFTSAFTATGVLSRPNVWNSNNGANEQWNYTALPRNGMNPLEDSGLTYEDEGFMITPWFDAGLPDLSKVFFDFEVYGIRGAPAGDITIEYGVENFRTVTWRTLGTTNLSNYPSRLVFPVDDDLLDPALTANRIRFRITLTNEGGADKIESWAMRFVVRPESRYGWAMAVRAYDEIDLLGGQVESGQADYIRNTLYQYRDLRLPLRFFDGKQLAPIANLVQNPSYDEDGLIMYETVSSSSLSISYLYKAFGRNALRATVAAGAVDQGLTVWDHDGVGRVPFPVVGGESILVSTYCYVQQGDLVTFQLIRTDAAGAFIEVVGERQFSIPTSGQSRFSRQSIWVSSATGGFYLIRVIRRAADSIATSTTIFIVDGTEFYTGETGLSQLASGDFDNPIYVDGNQLRCRWTGDPNNSTSVRENGYYVYITGLTEVERYTEETQPGLEYNSDITLELREVH